MKNIKDVLKDFRERNLGCCGGDSCPHYHNYGFEDIKDHDDYLEKWIIFISNEIIKEILPRPRKILGSVEKNDIWREGYNKCLWDIKQNKNKYYDK